MSVFRIPTADEVQAAQYAPLPRLQRPAASTSPQPQPPPDLLPTPPATATATTAPAKATGTAAPPKPAIIVAKRAAPKCISVVTRPVPHPSSSSVAAAPTPAAAQAAPGGDGGGAKAVGVVVHPRQRGNPLLDKLRGVPWAFASEQVAAKQVSDYHVSDKTGVLFLSLKFHLLDPAYISGRLLKMRGCYSLRVLLALCDVADGTSSASAALQELNVLSVLNSTTLVLAWSNDEAAQYIASLKQLERRSADAIREPMAAEEDTLARVVDCLTQIRSVNKTDAVALMKHFGVCVHARTHPQHWMERWERDLFVWRCAEQTLNAVMNASMEDLALCPGLGPYKVQRIHEMFHQPLRRGSGLLSQEYSWLQAYTAGASAGRAAKEEEEAARSATPRAKRARGASERVKQETIDKLIEEARSTGDPERPDE